ncbi:YrhK family protein [Actinomycetospora aeridis]|uniref:YrhK family protein n=1 Tax=Actinomycetospora aeridis TaxID=3129231 RepID=A0ABU8NH14_9PSEU
MGTADTDPRPLVFVLGHHELLWLFVVGRIELLIRPAIRLVRQVHLQRLPGRHGTPTDLGHDF